MSSPAPRNVATLIDSLTAEGYGATYICREEGLACHGHDITLSPEDLVVDREERFEGSSDPAEQQLVLALRHRRDAAPAGTLVVPYGPTASPIQARILRQLARTD